VQSTDLLSLNDAPAATGLGVLPAASTCKGLFNVKHAILGCVAALMVVRRLDGRFSAFFFGFQLG